MIERTPSLVSRSTATRPWAASTSSIPAPVAVLMRRSRPWTGFYPARRRPSPTRRRRPRRGRRHRPRSSSASGFVDGDRFRVTAVLQLRDYPEEPALLRGWPRTLPAFLSHVTFNGRASTSALLESRYRLKPERFTARLRAHTWTCCTPRGACVEAAPGVLPPANRVEMRAARHRAGTADVPGEEIPQYLVRLPARRDGRALVKVLEHNPGSTWSRCRALRPSRAGGWRTGGGGSARRLFAGPRPGGGRSCTSAARRNTAGWRRSTTTRCRSRSLLRLAPRKAAAGTRGPRSSCGSGPAAEGDWWALRELAGPPRASRPRPRGGPGRRAAGARAARGGRVATVHRVAADFRRRHDRLQAKRDARN